MRFWPSHSRSSSSSPKLKSWCSSRLNPAGEGQDQHHDQYHTDNAGRPVTPTGAITPAWERADQREDQDDDKNCTEHVAPLNGCRGHMPRLQSSPITILSLLGSSAQIASLGKTHLVENTRLHPAGQAAGVKRLLGGLKVTALQWSTGGPDVDIRLSEREGWTHALGHANAVGRCGLCARNTR